MMRSGILLLGLLPACAQADPAPDSVPVVGAASLEATQPEHTLPPDPAIDSAMAFLQAEVPKWRTENGCYSCHNNGDAARAVYLWVQRGGRSDDAIPDTSRWLQQPGEWEHNGGEGPFSDKRLATLQFAAALASASEAGFVEEDSALVEAAEQLSADQLESGAWQEPSGLIGGPITYGPYLATYMARRTLVKAGASRFPDQIEKSDRWFRETEVKTVLAAASTLLALEGAEDTEARAQRDVCMELIARGESPTGGWGPFAHSPPEVFDTALTMLSLLQFKENPDVAAMLTSGRAFLIDMQEADGGWLETTRPSGRYSYAHRISTSGWAVQALILTAGQ